MMMMMVIIIIIIIIIEIKKCNFKMTSEIKLHVRQKFYKKQLKVPNSKAAISLEPAYLIIREIRELLFAISEVRARTYRQSRSTV
jgi:hypothetical protein